jgi:hypothetical protein
MLLSHRVGPSITALMGHAGIITDTIEADLEIATALVAGFGATR